MVDRKGTRSGNARFAGIVCGTIVAALFITGCAEDKQKPMTQPSTDHVKGNADRGFDKLHHEERERKPGGM
ncbi:MAG: exported protein of unknown function [Nitrospira sp.]|jgi:hypothetical protein|nr:exported protein of unknown function [Nitrospira sp.]